MSNLSAFPFIPNRSEATPELWNRIFSTLSSNIRAVDSNVSAFSGDSLVASSGTFSLTSNLSIGRDLWVKGSVTVGAQPSSATRTALNLVVRSDTSDYVYFNDASAAKSNYIVGSHVGGYADGLVLWDASANTTIAVFSKQSIRFFQNVVGPVFDTGGALADTYNAATFVGSGSTLSGIQAAINQASSDAVARVYLPASMYPYDPSNISFIYTVRMVREGGDQGVYDIQAYGATGDGNTDDRIAILSAVSAANAQINGGVVFFPNGPSGTGKYRVLSALTLDSVVNLAFVGQGGANASQIFMGANGASCMVFTGVCSKILIRDLWLGSTSTRTSGYGLSIVGTVASHSDSFFVDRLTVQNVPTPLNLQMLDNSAFRDLRHIQSLVGATASDILSIQSCAGIFLYHLDNLVTAGTLPGHCYVLDHDTDTIVLDGCGALFAGNGSGFVCKQTAGSTGPRLSRFQHCFSESNSQSGFSISAGRDIRIAECHSAVNSGNGYTINGGTSITINNSLALQNAFHGFSVLGGGGPKGVMVTLCTASNNGTATDSTYDGINIANSVSDVRLIGNRCGDFVFGTPPNQRFGIAVGASASSIVVVGNNCHGNTNAGNDYSFGNDCTGIIFSDQRMTTESMTGILGDADVTVTVGGPDKTVNQFNTPLTTNRSFTINTGSAFNGGHYRVVRRLGATGAFDLAVRDSSGSTLKVLPHPGQWADVTYGGDNAWRLTASGNLLWFPDGTAVFPSINFSSESSLGWFRSANSTMALSYGSLSVPAAPAQSALAQFGAVDGVVNYVFLDGLRVSGENASDTIYNAGRSIAITADGGNTINLNATSSPGFGFTQLTATGESLSTGGSVLAPGWGFQSERSLGWFRSGVSTMALSHGTLNLATQAVRLSMRTLAASSLTATAAITNVAVNEVVFTIGGASGVSLAINSGGTTYYFNSDGSAKNT